MHELDVSEPDHHAAAAIARAERRLAILAELTEIGMAMARDLGRQTAQPPTPDSHAPPRDPADGFARLSRALRLTLVLEARLDAELAKLRAGVAIDVETWREAAAVRAEKLAQTESAAHRRAIERAVETAVESEIAERDERLACYEALNERLEWDEAYRDLESMTFTEAVQHLCADLNLSPDWSRWTDEGWSREPGVTRHPRSEFNRPSRRPVLATCDPFTPPPRSGWPSG
jgi:hypothetical protein